AFAPVARAAGRRPRAGPRVARPRPGHPGARDRQRRGARGERHYGLAVAARAPPAPPREAGDRAPVHRRHGPRGGAQAAARARVRPQRRRLRLRRGEDREVPTLREAGGGLPPRLQALLPRGRAYDGPARGAEVAAAAGRVRLRVTWASAATSRWSARASSAWRWRASWRRATRAGGSRCSSARTTSRAPRPRTTAASCTR